MSTKVATQSYWKSLNELAQNDEYKKFLYREFPENATELNDGHNRRHFLKIMGASIALAGLAACRKPVQKILPYTKRPVEIIPGIPNIYATSFPFMGSLTGLLVTSNDGRPTKIEGNPDHPASLGGTSIHHQADILSLYDPDRSRNPINNDAISEWPIFVSSLASLLNSNSRVAFLTEQSSSQTLSVLKQSAKKKFKKTSFVSFEPFGEQNIQSGNFIAFGTKVRTANHFDKANLIVSIGDDFLSDPVNGVANAKGFSRKRKLQNSNDSMNRLFVVESDYTITGSTADNRLAIKHDDFEAFVFALASVLSKNIRGLDTFKGYKNDFSSHNWISVLAAELTSNKGNSLITLNKQASPEAHAAISAINLALGNAGNTVTYYNSEEANTLSDVKTLFEEISNGDYDALIIIGGNPVYTLPKSIKASEAIKSAPLSIHLSNYVDETSKLCNWHVNKAHFLEAWGDGRSYTGAESIIQPLIQPLFNGKSDIEFLNAIVNQTDVSGYKLVQETWRKTFGISFDKKWRKALHDGIINTTTYPTVRTRLTATFSRNLSDALTRSKTSSNKMELVVKPDLKLVDGRYSNNGWLQELPDPVTKITWDNVALISINTAKSLGLHVINDDDHVPMISIKSSTGTVEVPVWVLPGHADNSITISLGYGREGVGRVASKYEFDDFDLVGFDVTSLLSADSYYQPDISITKIGKEYKIACTQDHSSMEGRALIRFANLDEYKNKPTFAPDMVKTPGVKEGDMFAPALFTPMSYPEYEPQWGMAIDLNACIGCGVCTIACQAENNIPVIGKKEVSRGREMHWIRVDRYFVGEENEPKMVHQPVPCMHCEMAPCEQVCPVAATTHSDDGLNQMTYNRCIGTRYCANNCPYKVRRFNFFNYSKEYLTTGNDPEIVQMAMNPDVTVRFRGVIEKCTYCVQRINRGKIDTKNKTGNSVKPKDGTVVTACQQACPTDAIYFGDLTDSNSTVSKMKQNNRNYRMLDELNVRPRTSYLAKITNSRKELV